MKYIKLLIVPMLFVSLAFMNVGGCGGSGDGGSNNNRPCEMPGLNTNFSNEAYIFFDAELGITMGVTSDGTDVVIALVDSFGTAIGAIADVIGAFACEIEVGIIGEDAFEASGLCGRSDDATLFLILDFFIGTIEFVDISVGECIDVEPLNVSNVSLEGTDPPDLAAIVERYHNEMMENRKQASGPFSIDNFTNTLRELE